MIEDTLSLKAIAASSGKLFRRVVLAEAVRAKKADVIKDGKRRAAASAKDLVIGRTEKFRTRSLTNDNLPTEQELRNKAQRRYPFKNFSLDQRGNNP